MDLSKRRLLKVFGVGGIGVLGMGSPLLSRKSLAASWTVNDASAETIDGKISKLQIKQENFDLNSFKWNNLSSDDSEHVFTVRFLTSTESMSSYEEIGVGEFSHSSDSGSISSISFDVNPFPVNFFNAPSISTSDFESIDDGETASTTVDLKIVFETDSVSDSSIQSFDVNVTNIDGLTYIDNFEDGDLIEYSVFNGGGEDDIESSTVAEGSNSVRITTESSGSSHLIQSSSGLDRYPNSGDSYQYRTYLPNSSTIGYHFFGYQDSNNRYQVQTADGDSSLYIRDSGSFTKLDGSTASLPTDEWLIVTIDWGKGGVIDVTIKDDTGSTLTTFSGTDRTFTEGGVGWGAGGGSSTESCYFDAAKITEEASETGTIDDFEDGNLSEYTVSDPNWSISTSHVYEGTYSVEAETPSTDEHVHPDLLSYKGLNRYPEIGDTFEWYFYLTMDSQMMFSWFTDGTTPFSGYQLQTKQDNNTLELRDTDGTLIASGTWENNTGKWYRAEVTHDTDGSITAEIFDNQGNSQSDQLTATSQNRTKGGIHLKMNEATDGGKMYFDNINVI